jgi:hypothetical protein
MIHILHCPLLSIMYYPESGIVLFDRRVSSEWDHDDHAVIAPGIVHGQAWGDTLTIDLTVATTEMRTMAHDGLVHDVRILTPGADIGLNIVLCRDRTVESSLFCTIAGVNIGRHTLTRDTMAQMSPRR